MVAPTKSGRGIVSSADLWYNRGVITMDELKKRKTPRYQSFDYNSVGVYFITICTQNRRCIPSRIVGTGVLDCPSETGALDCPQIELTQYGEIADKYIKQLNDFYEHLSVENYVIMPNHIHFLLWVKENKNKPDNGQSGTPVPTNVERANSVCSQFVSTFKRFCNAVIQRHRAKPMHLILLRIIRHNTNESGFHIYNLRVLHSHRGYELYGR